MKQIVQSHENRPEWMDYFKFMGAEERQAIVDWRAEVSAAVQEERLFLQRVDEALAVVTEDFAISRVAPEWALLGKRLTFGSGVQANELLSALEWGKLAKEFAPAYKSEMATRHQLILYYAHRVAKGKLTLRQVCGSARPRYSVDEVEMERSANLRHVREAEKRMALNKRVVVEGEGYAIMGGGGNRRYGAIGAMVDVFALTSPEQPIERASCVIVIRP